MTDLQRGFPIGVTDRPTGRFDHVSTLLGRIGFGRSAPELARTRREIALAAVVWFTGAAVTMRSFGVWIAFVLFVWTIPFAVLAILALWAMLEDNTRSAAPRRREIVAVLSSRRRSR